MKSILKLVTAVGISIAPAFAMAQLQLPTRNIGGTQYYYRSVAKKETIYGISKELGITKEEIIKYNPSVANGLQAGQTLYFPVADFGGTSKTMALPSTHKHQVKSGETIYGIAKMYGLSVSELLDANPTARNGLKADTELTIPVNASSEATPYVVKAGDTLYRLSVNFNVSLADILEINPGVSPDNFKTGMTILIPTATNKEQAKTEPRTVFVLDKVEKGESFESISEEYGVPVERVKEANPNVEKLKKGSMVTVPITNSTTTEDVAVAPVETPKISSVNIAILLPFESRLSTKSNQAIFYQEFYRGALLAIYDNKSQKVNLSVYDINATNLSNVLSKTDVKNAQIIFGPSEDDLLKPIIEFGATNKINVVNAFSINDDSFYENSQFLLMNTPSSYMYSAVRKYIEDKFAKYDIVFLTDDSSEEKPLIQQLKQSSLPQFSINVDNSDFVCSQKTLFVPTSSTRASLKKVKAFVDAVNAEPKNDGQFAVFGYPEWSLYSEFENFLKANNVYIFSRYRLEKDKALASRYAYWYNEQPANTVPRMYEIGYDVTNFFIDAIYKTNNDFTKALPQAEGHEIGINMVRASNWCGFVNTSTFIYQYTSTGLKTKIVK